MNREGAKVARRAKAFPDFNTETKAFLRVLGVFAVKLVPL